MHATASSPALRRIPCADRDALERAYLLAADAPWVDGCTVDLPNLRLELRIADPWRGEDCEQPLARLARIAGGATQPPSMR